MVAAGHGDRPAIHALIGGRKYSCTYRQLLVRANRIAHVLVEDLKLVPGNRVLLRGPNNPMMAACWFGIIKAGCIAVATMPLLRAKELEVIVDKARIGAALCDVRLKDELEIVRTRCRDLKRVLYFNDGGAGSLEAALERKPAEFANADTADRRRRADRLHLRHDRAAQGLHALPPRRDGDVRRVPALVPEADARRRLLRHPAARVHVRPRRDALLPLALRRLDRADGATHAGDAARDDPRLPRDRLLHRAHLLPPDGAARAEVRPREPEEVRVRRRGAARRDAPGVQAGDRHRAPRRPRLDRDDPHLRLARGRQGRGRARPATRSPAIARPSWTTTAIRARPAPSAGSR